MFAKFLIQTDCFGNTKFFCYLKQIIQIFYCAAQSEYRLLTGKRLREMTAQLWTIMGKRVIITDRLIGAAIGGNGEENLLGRQLHPDIPAFPMLQVLCDGFVGRTGGKKNRAAKT